MEKQTELDTTNVVEKEMDIYLSDGQIDRISTKESENKIPDTANCLQEHEEDAAATCNKGTNSALDLSEGIEPRDTNILDNNVDVIAVDRVGSSVDAKGNEDTVQPLQPALVSVPTALATHSSEDSNVELANLDNLRQLMGHLGNLRQQNSKLQKRVQYLEDLKNLQEMHQQLEEESKQRRLQKDELLQSLQNRSPVPDKQSKRRFTGKSGANKAKVSKWTKVKEAFRWEKASVTMYSEPKSCDTVVSSWKPRSDDSRYLKIPSASSDSKGDALSASPADSAQSGHTSSACSSRGQSPGYRPHDSNLSSSSSSEDVHADLQFSDLFTEFGPQRSASASDSTRGRLLSHDGRRLSLTQTPEDDASRRSKSLDGDAIIGSSDFISRHLCSKDGASSTSDRIPCNKQHKTPWGKVKDIIQTRKDSLKRKHHRSGKAKDCGQEGHEDLVPAVQLSPPPREDGDPELTDPGDSSSRPASEANKRQNCKVSTGSLGSGTQLAVLDTPAGRRLTPTLTITLPSTEELHHLAANPGLPDSTPVCRKPPPSPQVEERHHKVSVTSAPDTQRVHPPEFMDDSTTSATNTYKRQKSLQKTSRSAETSPPVNRRSSKWTKVKKAFLTSDKGRRGDDETRISSSVPSSPNRNSSFFYDIDVDDLLCGDYVEMGESGEEVLSEPAPTIQAEIQRNYVELQQKLSQEFQKKLQEWEKIKATSPSNSQSSGRGGGSAGGSSGDEAYLHHDKSFRRKMEEWERIKNPQPGKHRESVTFQQLDEDNLSPEFKKKLQEWQRIKSLPSSYVRDEPHGGDTSVQPPFKKKIAELWRTGSSKQEPASQQANDERQLSEDFQKKLQEWERIKGGDTWLTQDGATQENADSGTEASSPGVARKNSAGPGKDKRASRKCGNKSASLSFDSSGGGDSSSKAGAAAGKFQKSKTQKEKEKQWLEKELQKIEKEKQRLEREREKYLEKEARLEKMRRTIGSTPREEEILIQTSTGSFRFQGISQEFTKRLYEWEQARGIGPEESTFTLLDPDYQPSAEETRQKQQDGLAIPRSKSASSVSNLTTGMGSTAASISHQASSLSLNDVKQPHLVTLEGSRTHSEPQFQTYERVEDAEDGSAAVIVDVEAVVEETAAPLSVSQQVKGQTPVYCYAPEEITRLIDSSGSESEKDNLKSARRGDLLQAHSKYKIIEKNQNCLPEMKVKGAIARKVTADTGSLKDPVAVDQDHTTGMSGPAQQDLISQLRARIRTLEQRQLSLRQAEESLENSSPRRTQQESLQMDSRVQHLSISEGFQTQGQTCPQVAITRVQDLSSQLLYLACKLETVLVEKDRQLGELEMQTKRRPRLRAAAQWQSEDGMSLGLSPASEASSADKRPTATRGDTDELSSLLTSTVLQLKEQLNFLCDSLDAAETEQYGEDTNQHTVEHSEIRDKNPTNSFDVSVVSRTDRNTRDFTGEAGSEATLQSPWLEGEPARHEGPQAADAVAARRVLEQMDKYEELLRTLQQSKRRSRGGGLSGLMQKSASVEVITPTDYVSQRCTTGDSKHDSVEATSVTPSSEATQDIVVPIAIDAVPVQATHDSLYVRSHKLSRVTLTENRATQPPLVYEEVKVTNNVLEHKESVNAPRNTPTTRDGLSLVEEAHANNSSAFSLTSEVSTDCEEDLEYTEELTEDKDGSSDSEEEAGTHINKLPDRHVVDVMNSKHDEDSTDDSDIDSKNLDSCTKRKSSICFKQNIQVSTSDPQNIDDNHCSVLQICPTREEINLDKEAEMYDNTLSDTHVAYKMCSDSHDQTAAHKSKACANDEVKDQQTHVALECANDTDRLTLGESNDESIICMARSDVNGLATVSTNTSQSDVDVSLPPSCEQPQPYNSLIHPRTELRIHTSPLNFGETTKGKLVTLCTPSNVFVKTTRKIFSPVGQDSKGKASSVISYVLEETTSAPGQESMDSTNGATSDIMLTLKQTQEVKPLSRMVAEGKLPGHIISPPAWMIRQSRSQSSSPAVQRRNRVMWKDESQFEKCGENYSSSTSSKSTPDINFNVTNRKDSFQNIKSQIRGYENSSTVLESDRGFRSMNDCKIPSKIGISGNEQNSSINNLFKTFEDQIVSAGTPPKSPSPGRRDLIKMASKETAPSIRMMIAKYNQKLNEQDIGGGKSPEIGGSGSGSPVAWRSPVAERRVLAQREKYQEEVQKVLKQAILGTRMGWKLQKSASVEIITPPGYTTGLSNSKVYDEQNKNIILRNTQSPNIQRRGILKSSSASSVKPTPAVTYDKKHTDIVFKTCFQPYIGPLNDLLPSTATQTMYTVNDRAVKQSVVSSILSRNPLSPSCPDMGSQHPTSSRLRALKIQRAKEEFLTRDPATRSWNSDASASVSPEPPSATEIREVASTNRLSQASAESESSYERSLTNITGDIKEQSNYNLPLMKSASAGMINVDPTTYKKLSQEHHDGKVTPISKSQSTSKFGISSIASKFRKVKMRKSKDRDAPKMNTVSTLCRQSLLVDLHLDSLHSGLPQPTSKSCPASPVLPRMCRR